MVGPTPTPTAPKPVPTPGAPVAAKPAGEKKEPKAPKPKKEGAIARPRLPKYDENHVITVLKENAKARNANKRFQGYKTGMTVKQYVDKMKDEHGRTDGQTFAD